MVKYILKLALFALLSIFSLSSFSLTQFPVQNLNYQNTIYNGQYVRFSCVKDATPATTAYQCGQRYTGSSSPCSGKTIYSLCYAITPPQNATNTVGSFTFTTNEGYNAVNNNGTWSVVPAGSECTGGKVYNTTTGFCDTPTPPACTTAQKRITFIYSLDTASSVSNLFPVNTCSNGCEYTISDANTSDCFTSFNGSSQSSLYCPGDYNGTGASCTGSSPETTSPPAEPPASSCATGSVRNDIGICQPTSLCPADSQRNDAGMCVQVACQPDYIRLGDGLACVPKVQCTLPAKPTAQNTCEVPPAEPCPSGQYRSLDDLQCYAEPKWDESCKAPMVKNASGSCVNPETVTNPPASGTNFDGSTDHDGNPNTAGSNEPGRPGSNKNLDGSPNTDGNPQTVNDPPVSCTGFDCEEPQDQGTCSPGSPTWNAETQTCGSTGSSQIIGDNELGYAKGDSTFQGVLTDFTSNLNNTPVFKAVNSFLGLNIASVQCPVFEQQIMQGFLGQQGFTIRVDQHCSDFADDVFPIMEAVLMAVAAFVAFRWAVL